MYIMEPPMKVAKWGNSLAIRLSKPMVEALGVSEGDDVKFDIDGAGVVTMKREMTRSEWVESLRRLEGRLPADFKFDREEANSRDD
jgi:antitoxin MazE